jgi:hypothetical protein
MWKNTKFGRVSTMLLTHAACYFCTSCMQASILFSELFPFVMNIQIFMDDYFENVIRVTTSFEKYFPAHGCPELKNCVRKCIATQLIEGKKSDDKHQGSKNGWTKLT